LQLFLVFLFFKHHYSAELLGLFSFQLCFPGARLGKAQVLHELGVAALLRLEAVGGWPLQAVPVGLFVLVLGGVVLGLRHDEATKHQQVI